MFKIVMFMKIYYLNILRRWFESKSGESEIFKRIGIKKIF